MIVQCQELSKLYKSDGRLLKAVDGVDLEVAAGDFVVILGHSGSGKTTLLSLIGGLTKPEQGRVLVKGIENWRQSDNALAAMRNRTVGFIFQFASLIPTLTVMENLLLPMSFGGQIAESRAKASQLLAEVGLAEKVNAYPAQLSGGQQRRIAIARAFITQPEIILADEPTGDLDEETELEILNFFRQRNAEGTTFIVVTHNRELARSQNRARVLEMRNGVLSAAGGEG